MRQTLRPNMMDTSIGMVLDRWILKLVDTWHTEVRRTLDVASVV
jgi:hypothetical protein